MKKATLLAFVLIAGISVSQAHNRNKNTWGLTGGMKFPMNGFTFKQTGEKMNSIFTSEEKSTGWHAGMFGRVYANDQLYFGSNLIFLKNDHELVGFDGDQKMSETFTRAGSQLDVLAGIEFFDFVRAYGGVNGNVYFNNTWNETFDSYGTGYLFGAGVDIWKLTIDVRYNGSFKDHEGSWKGIPLSYNRSDLMVGIGIKF